MRRLPLRMRTVFQDVLLPTWAVDPSTLAGLLPGVMRPWLHHGRAYVSIVIANMRGMRPAPLPEMLGSNAYQIVYRAIVTLREAADGERRGVFFLRSDCNDPVLSYFGNRMTEFRFHYFHTGAIGMYRRGDGMLVTAETADRGGDLVIHGQDRGPADRLPPAPGFRDPAEEKQSLVQLFHAYAYDPAKGLIYDMEIERGNWDVRRLEWTDGFAAFFTESPFTADTAEPASLLYIRECHYVFKPVMALDEAAFVAR